VVPAKKSQEEVLMKKSETAKKVMLINAQHPEECRAVVLDNNVIDQPGRAFH
jgi:hypothetical protein